MWKTMMHPAKRALGRKAGPSSRWGNGMKYKRLKNNRTKGETLVETVVSFSVLLILLAMLGVALRGAANMSIRAAEMMAMLEEDCARVEQNTGLYNEAGAVSDTLILMPEDHNLSNIISIPLDLRSGELLHYFTTAQESGD